MCSTNRNSLHRVGERAVHWFAVKLKYTLICCCCCFTISYSVKCANIANLRESAAAIMKNNVNQIHKHTSIENKHGANIKRKREQNENKSTRMNVRTHAHTNLSDKNIIVICVV